MDRSSHLTFEEMYEYVNIEEATDENIEFFMEVGMHIDSCEECLEKLRIMDGLRSTFEKWTAATHGEIYQRLIFNQSLLKLADDTENLQIKARLMNWYNQHFGKSGSAIRLMMKMADEIKGEVTKIIPESIQTLVACQPRWNFEYAQTSLRGSGNGIKIKTKVIDTKKSGTEIYVNGAQKVVRIKLCDISPDQAPLVVLISKDNTAKPVVKLPIYDEDYKCWIAEFENIASGEYVIALEPI